MIEAPLVGTALTKRFGGLTAVAHVDVEARAGEVTALIGPNGAGKTTLFQCLTGVLLPDAGHVLLHGQDVTRASSDQRARRGLGRTFQRLAVFGQLTVAENLRVAAQARRRTSLLRELLRLRTAAEPDVDRRVAEVLAQLGLAELADAVAETLPTGTLRLVELGRALCGDPTVLLLDEPASGLDERETDNLRQVLLQIAAAEVAVVLVEHDVELVLDVSSQVYVLDQGRLLAQGPPDQVRQDPLVRAAYLGTELADQ
jgi:branched-chain amino acid transport system ATP-binding protein